MVRGSAAAALAAVLAACSSDTGSGSYAVRDSAGVRIVTSDYPAWEDGGAWTVSAEPTLQIGERDGPEELQLFQVRDVARLADGRIAALDGGSSTLKLFDQGGAPSAVLSGPGDGPGELRTPVSLEVVGGDTLQVWDVALGRVASFTPAGRLSDRTIEVGLPIVDVLRLRDGRPLVVTRGAPAGPPDLGIVRRDPVPLLVLEADPSNPAMDTLGVFPGVEMLLIRTPMYFLLAPPPYARALHVDLLDSLVALGTAEELEVRLLASSGRVHAIYRGPPRDLTVTEEDRRWWRERLTERAASEEERRNLPAILEAQVFPDVRAAYNDLLVDATGAIWLRTGRDFNASPSRDWTIFSAEGVLLGTLALPERFQLHEIGEDYLLGVWRDDFDVEYVRMYALAR